MGRPGGENSVLVLVVDDDGDFRALLARALRARGHEVELRDSAFGLVNRVSGFDHDGEPRARPDVVVLDHMLPGLPGADVLDLLARSPRTSDVPVLLVSNGFPEELAERAKGHPLCRFAPKTGRMMALADEVESLVAEVVTVSERAG